MGAPAWLDAFDSAYDMEGRPSGPVAEEQCREMVQSLFVDRFKLAMHRDMKETSGYLLTFGRNGTKLRRDGCPISHLAACLSDVTGRPVVDRTGPRRSIRHRSQFFDQEVKNP